MANPITLPSYGFVDGAYLRKLAEEHDLPWPDPHAVIRQAAYRGTGIPLHLHKLIRVEYFDGRPDDDAEVAQKMLAYWAAIERVPDTALGFGFLRGEKPPRQKGVDTLLAVRMLIGAFNRIYKTALLCASDADYVPVVEEVKRLGVQVLLVAAEDRHLSEDLRRSADRFCQLVPEDAKQIPALDFEAGQTL